MQLTPVHCQLQIQAQDTQQAITATIDNHSGPVLTVSTVNADPRWAIVAGTDLKTNGGIVFESAKLAVNLSATDITGTLAVTDGGYRIKYSSNCWSVINW